MPLFITGSDTGVGKTVVTALLAAEAQARGRSVCVYKPVQTGSAAPDQPEDPLTVNRWLAKPVDAVNTYNFLEPVAPYVADAGRSIRPAVIRETVQDLLNRYEEVLVEGAGGVRVPIAPGYEMIDLMTDLALPVLVVVRPDLGTINHTLLTVEALTIRGLEIRAVVVSGYPSDSCDPAIRSLPEVFARFLPGHRTLLLPPLQSGKLGRGHPQMAAWLEYNIL